MLLRTLFFDELYVRLAEGGQEGFDVFRPKKVGWDQIIQLIECDDAGRICDLYCPSD
jgi:hypothetical protein